MKTQFDIYTYLRSAEGGFSNFGDYSYDVFYEFEEEPEQPTFNRKRILLLCR